MPAAWSRRCADRSSGSDAAARTSASLLPLHARSRTGGVSHRAPTDPGRPAQTREQLAIAPDVPVAVLRVSDRPVAGRAMQARFGVPRRPGRDSGRVLYLSRERHPRLRRSLPHQPTPAHSSSQEAAQVKNQMKTRSAAQAPTNSRATEARGASGRGSGLVLIGSGSVGGANISSKVLDSPPAASSVRGLDSSCALGHTMTDGQPYGHGAFVSLC